MPHLCLVFTHHSFLKAEMLQMLVSTSEGVFIDQYAMEHPLADLNRCLMPKFLRF